MIHFRTFAIITRHDLAARLALVPLMQEARGLDGGPKLIQRLTSLCDSASAKVVNQIVEVCYVDLITHTAMLTVFGLV